MNKERSGSSMPTSKDNTLAPGQRAQHRHFKRTVAAALALLQVLPMGAWAQQTVPTKYEYDAQGNRTKVTDPNGVVTDLVPDQLDRLQKQIFPKPKASSAARPEVSYTYDGLNRLTKVVDPNGAVTTYSFSGLSNVSQLSADTGTLDSLHDKAGNLKQRTNEPGQATYIDYDVLNRPLYISYYDETESLTGYTVLGYDAFNTTAGQENYGRGRLTGVAEFDPDGATITTMILRYDQLGRVTRRCQFISGSGTGTACAEADALYYRWAPASDTNAGRLLGLTYPAGSSHTTGRKVDYQYDALGLITGITTTEPDDGSTSTVLSNIVNTPLAVAEGGYAPKSWNFGPTPSTPQQSYRRYHDTSGSTYFFTIGRGANDITNSGHQLDLDEAGRVLSILSYDSSGIAISQTYGYDDLNRLISANLNGTTYSYDYDDNGNRTLKTAAAISTVYTYATPSSKLSTVKVGTAASQTVTSDTVGNIKQDPAAPVGEVKYIYDNNNPAPYGRLVKTQGPGAQYTYLTNHLGQRIRKTGANYTPPGGSAISPTAYIGSTDTVFHYDLEGHLIAEIDAATKQVKREYIWLGDTPVAVIAGVTPTSQISASNAATVYYIHTDHLNTPRMVTDAAGNKRWSWSIVTGEPFGASPANEAPQAQVAAQQFVLNLRFPGQYLDKETGTFYNYHRTYNPATGRYLQSDPIGLNGGFNTYAYVSGNPVGIIDPLGLANGSATRVIRIPKSTTPSKPITVSIGAGGAGNLMPIAGSAESGLAIDTTGAICYYSQVCAGVGINDVAGGVLGISGGVQSGALSTCTQNSKVGYWSGGVGWAGEGQVSTGADGSQYQRGIYGVGKMAGVGGMTCQTTYVCLNR